MSKQQGEAQLDYEHLLSGTVEEVWARCLPHWRPRGRVEDYPRNAHYFSYTVSPEKWLGRGFAQTFPDEIAFLVAKLRSADPTEAASAHDILFYIFVEGGCADPATLPDPIATIPVPIPDWVRAEIEYGKYESFSGGTIGELFAFEQRQL